MNTVQSIFREMGSVLEVKARHSLLHAGDVAQHLYLIEQGCVRLCLINVEGRETSTQFFFEGDIVGSLESFLVEFPSTFSLITIEECRLCMVDSNLLKQKIEKDSDFQSSLQILTQQRLIHYISLYASTIADSPTDRYLALLEEHKEQLDRIPLQYLASYLGVSAVHLSRIRRKLKDSS
jgi:CRP-like cAMP-binding protein